MGKFIRTPIYQQLSDSEFTKMAADKSLPQRDQDRDDTLTKIVKYVPVEVTAAFTAAVAFFSSQGSITDNSKQVFILVSFVVGLAAAPIYFYYSAWTDDGLKTKPAWYFYLFAFFCFPVWALVTSSNAREAISPFSIGFYEWKGVIPLTSHKVAAIDPGDAEIALFIVAILVPALDQALTKVLARRKLLIGAKAAGTNVRDYEKNLQAA